MIAETQLIKIEENFSIAAQEFGFEFHRPFVLDGGITAFGHITNYGSEKGTIIWLDTVVENQSEIGIFEAFARCKASGYFCSFLNPDCFCGAYDRDCFEEMLQDWGKFV